MPIRARVGRHTRADGRQCQNWVDDQKTVIELLNRIPAASGGAGGSLKPRVVAGIASNELYAAIVAFEAKHFSGQRLGFFEPGGPMFKKLEALGTPAAAPRAPARPAPAPAPAAPPPPDEPTTGDIPRYLTPGEKDLLRPIFGDTLDYERQMVDRNDINFGGEDNSFTPGYIPNMARPQWSFDYSLTFPTRAAVFVHEMVHVWQFGHGGHNARNGVWLRLTHRDYGDAYKYDLDSSALLSNFNMEQQAAIIEDYYLVSRNRVPDNNVGPRRLAQHYAPYVAQLKNAGAFRWPSPTPRKMRDYIGNRF
jgi:hypothetical protein